MNSNIQKIDILCSVTKKKFARHFENHRCMTWRHTGSDQWTNVYPRDGPSLLIEVNLWQTNLKTNVCRNHSFQVNRKKNATEIRLLTSSNQAAIFVSTSCEERHNKLFLAIWLGQSTDKALLFFSGKETIQAFNGSISVSHHAVVCEVINLWIAMFKKTGGDSHMKGAEMLVVSLRCVNFRFWSRLGFSGKNVIIFRRKGLF